MIDGKLGVRDNSGYEFEGIMMALLSAYRDHLTNSGTPTAQELLNDKNVAALGDSRTPPVDTIDVRAVCSALGWNIAGKPLKGVAPSA